MSKRIDVEVIFATPEEQTRRKIQLPVGSTLERAIHASGILSFRPEIDLDKMDVGVYGRRQPKDTVLEDGARVEIYRPTIAKRGNKE